VSAIRKDNDAFSKEAGKSEHPDGSSSQRGSHVLIVGPGVSGDPVRCALLGEPNLTLSIVANYRELWTIPNLEIIHLVILNNALSTIELAASGRLIRQRWPQTRILIVGPGQGSLEIALYDDRVSTEDTQKVLREKIGRLLFGPFERSRHDAR